MARMIESKNSLAKNQNILPASSNIISYSARRLDEVKKGSSDVRSNDLFMFTRRETIKTSKPIATINSEYGSRSLDETRNDNSNNTFDELSKYKPLENKSRESIFTSSRAVEKDSILKTPAEIMNPDSKVSAKAMKNHPDNLLPLYSGCYHGYTAIPDIKFNYARSLTHESELPKCADDEDSFLQHITSRSPAKPVPRNEDSVEALDQLDKVLDVLHEVAKLELMLEHDSPRKPRAKKLNDHTSLTSKKAHQPTKLSKPHVKPTTEKFHTKKIAQTYLKTNDKQDSSRFPPKNSTTKTSPGTTLPKKSISVNNHTTRPAHKSPGEKIPETKKLRETSKNQCPTSEISFQENDTSPVVDQRNTSSRTSLKPPFSEMHDDVFTRLSAGNPKNRLSSSKIVETKRKDVLNRQASDANLSVSQATSGKRRISSKNPRVANDVPNRSSFPQSIKSKILNPQVSITNSHMSGSRSIIDSPKFELSVHSPSQGSMTRERKDTCTPKSSCAKNSDPKNKEKINSVILARAEAAERGRKTLKEWAEKRMAKRLDSAIPG